MATILIVESNLFLGGILSQRLVKEGYEVLTTKDGKEGLRLIIDNHPVLVFLDLPIGHVKTFLGVLRQLHRKFWVTFPPIIVLSDVEEGKSPVQVSDLGVQAYLVKAYTEIDEMISKVKEILDSDIQAVRKNSPTAPAKPLVTEQKRIKAEIDKMIVVDSGGELPIVPLMDHLIWYAYLSRASDIHIKPEGERVAIRLRIDGILQDTFSFPKGIQSEIITRIKVLAGMRTDEHQTAQDGRFKTNIKGIPRQFDIRVSVVPTYYGENAVLRLLVEHAEITSLEDLSFSDADRAKLMKAIAKPNGMILATGPT